MKFDKNQVKKVFADYTKNYDISDPKVSLKVAHTYRVSELCRRIAKSISLPEEDCDIAWFCGMLHDIGRFEQLRIYNTFIDSQSVNHAHLGHRILFEEGRINDYLVECPEDGKDAEDADLEIVKKAIYYHSDYRLPKELDDRTKMFCDILRDADKIDILRVNVETPLEDIYNVTTKELRGCAVTQAVMDNFMEGHATLRSLKKAPVDFVVGHISLAFELVYPESRRAVKEQGYLDKLMHFSSDLPETEEQFVLIRRRMAEFLGEE